MARTKGNTATVTGEVAPGEGRCNVNGTDISMRNEMRHLLRILKALQRIDPEFPIQYAVCLTEISLDEGLSLSELAGRTGLALSTVSRIVGALSEKRQGAGKPYGLVTVKISAGERRRKELYLSPEGRAVLAGIVPLLHAPLQKTG